MGTYNLFRWNVEVVWRMFVCAVELLPEFGVQEQNLLCITNLKFFSGYRGRTIIYRDFFYGNLCFID